MAVIMEGGFTIPMPRMARVRQLFRQADQAVDIAKTVDAMFRDERTQRLSPGSRVALAVGSRGIVNIDTIIMACIEKLKEIGVQPFIVPAMGSHGGATAEGQLQMLKGYGITAERMGVPIKSSMNVEKVGVFEDGLPLYMDAEALHSDGIIVINRIKPHTGFRGSHESGLLKMMTIGLGKHLGATTYHNYGLDQYARMLPRIGEILISATPIVGGLAVLEDAYHQTTRLEFLWKEDLIAREEQLLAEAKSLMPKLLVNKIDVLVVNDFGKEISGPGMDPNITGRPVSPYVKIEGVADINKLVVLNLTPGSKGNAVGIGVADVTTRKFIDRMDLGNTYANSITSTFLNSAKIPMYMNNDFEAIQVALKACTGVTHPHSRIVWIQDTLHLDEIYVSETYLQEMESNPQIQVLDEPGAFVFDCDGNLAYPSLR
jgi:hypothetical protein